MNPVFICDAVRTPIGRYGGVLSSVRADDLGAAPLKALLQRNPALDPQAIDDVCFGCANQAGEDNRNVARMSALLAGLPFSVSAATINRLCGSGLNAVGSAAHAIAVGEQHLAIAGGVESMSRAPLVVHKAGSAFDRTQLLEDTTMGWRFINPQMKALYGVDSMPQTAENLARQFGISRADQDAFALRSQQRAGAAQLNGFFSEEIVPVLVPGKKRGETVEVTRDESLRADTTLERLAKLKPLFEDGTVTAGNASGINDGAAALILASESAVRRFGLQPRARVLGMATAGVEPRIMGIGPAPATQKLLRRLKLNLSDFDAIEINEAFAGQVLSCLREFELSPDHHAVNPNGGAIALGHPLGMSGVRLAATVVHQLQRTGSRLGLATMCIGVGQGIALAVERC